MHLISYTIDSITISPHLLDSIISSNKLALAWMMIEFRFETKNQEHENAYSMFFTSSF